MADSAFLKAKHVDNPQARAEYLTLAAGWHALAQEMEREDSKLAQLEALQESLSRTGNKDPGLG
jgi:hypothetical protein